MGIERLKTYRLTCDGTIKVTERLPSGVAYEGLASCGSVTTVQTTSKVDLMIDLERNMVGDYPEFTGWHVRNGGVRCPRSDHVSRGI